ncbi:hypothetical protein [Desulfovibrio sp. TomC]|uniref:hypothetical protein n=1 Tax=Desulfovibrio sp. TomC TaxID=1562888 RepID=UPI000575D125|nr:hypothetical protein [Desulfovibrio sp. TomC]KHK00788.1 hypothetical protein NY78_3796 [Desulfovibrio sp. TomC]
MTDLPGAPKLRTETTLTADINGSWRDLLGLANPGASDSLVAPPASTVVPPPSADPPNAAIAPDPATSGQAQASIQASADAAGVRLERLDLRLPRGLITATGAAAFGPRPSITGEITAEDVPFDSLPLSGGSGGWPVPGPWIFGCDLDVQAVVHRAAVAGLTIPTATASLRGSGGTVRLYPATAVLPGGGVASIDARLTATGGPDSGPGCTIQAALAPSGTKARFSGSLDATGAAGTWALTSPSPAAAAKVLGLAALPAVPLEAKGQLTFLAGQSGRWSASGLEARLGGTTLRGQLGAAASPPGSLAFDLAVESLDLDHLPVAGPSPAASGEALPQARGKLRLDHLTGHGIEVRSTVLDLTLGDGAMTAAVDSAEVYGGKLTGSVERLPSGRIAAALQLTGAEAGKLLAKPGLPLSGPITAKLASRPPARPRAISAR